MIPETYASVMYLNQGIDKWIKSYAAKNVEVHFAYHYLYLKFADLQIMFIIDVHSF